MSKFGSIQPQLRLVRSLAGREGADIAGGGGRAHLGVVPTRLPDLPDDLLKSVHEVENQIGILLSGDAGPVDNHQRQRLTAIVESISSAESLLDLLKWKRDVDEEAVESAPFDLRFPLRDVLEDHAAAARTRRVKLDWVLPSKAAMAMGNRSLMVDLIRFSLVELIRGANRGNTVRASLLSDEGAYTLRLERCGKTTVGRRFTQTGEILARCAVKQVGGSFRVQPGGAVIEIRIPAAQTRVM